MKNKIVTAYLSHPIRGINGATDEGMLANNKKAIDIGDILTHIFPELKVYVPGRMDGFLLSQGINPVSVVEGLLTLDCAIIGTRDLLLVYNWEGYTSKGMQREIDYAIDNEIAMIMFKDIKEAISKISEYING